MGEDDPEREADQRAEREADRGLLGREGRVVEQRVHEQGAADLRRVEEGADDRMDVGHGGVVDGERPGDPGRDPDPAVELPQPPERRRDGDEEQTTPPLAPEPRRSGLAPLDRDRRHAALSLPHSPRTL